jgi:hypothetical protein
MVEYEELTGGLPGLLQNPSMERAFSPYPFCCLIPGASPQTSDMDRALGALQLIILPTLKRRRRDAIPAWGFAPGLKFVPFVVSM